MKNEEQFKELMYSAHRSLARKKVNNLLLGLPNYEEIDAALDELTDALFTSFYRIGYIAGCESIKKHIDMLLE